MADGVQDPVSQRLRPGARRAPATPVTPSPEPMRFPEPTARPEPTTPPAPTLPPEPTRDVSHRAPVGGRSIVAMLTLTVVLAVVLGGIVAAYAATRPASYRSTAVLEIDQVNAIAGSGDEGVLAKLGRLRYKYAGIVSTDAFAGPVAQQAGLPTSEVHGSLFASVDPTSLLMSVGAINASPKDAQRIAQVAASQVVTYVAKEQTTARIPANQQVTFTVLSPAAPAEQIAPDRKRALLVGGLTALAVVVAGAVLADQLHRRRS